MAAERLLATLSQENKFAFGGLLAALMRERAAFWGEEAARQLMHRIGRFVLKLPEVECEAFGPILERDAPVPASAFVELLPAGEDERAALLLALLVLSVTSEDAQLIGYDARMRQLLTDASVALAVPWSRLTAMEKELVRSMRAQAAAGQQDSSRRVTSAGSSGGGSSDRDRPSSAAKWRKRFAVAGIGVASGVAVGLTAGLAAPAVLTGLAAVGSGISGLGGAATAVGATVSATAAMLSGAVGVTVVTTVFGATGAGLASYLMGRHVHVWMHARAMHACPCHACMRACTRTHTRCRPCLVQDGSSARRRQGVRVCAALGRVGERWRW